MESKKTPAGPDKKGFIALLVSAAIDAVTREQGSKQQDKSNGDANMHNAIKKG